MFSILYATDGNVQNTERNYKLVFSKLLDNVQNRIG